MLPNVSFPPPHYQVLGKEPELVLDPVRVEDGGNYTCHASNELGHDISRPVIINTFCELTAHHA